MGQVIIRNLDDRVIELLKFRARVAGKSLEQELRDILGATVTPSPEGRAAMADQARSLTLPVPQTDSSALVREDRDR